MSIDKINILLATYNGETYIKDQIESLLTQTHQDFIITIRDDGSIDRTVGIIKYYQSLYPNKIELINDTLGNLGNNLNFMKLLEYSQCKYIMFCDQDDIWLPKKIEITLSKMKQLENRYSANVPILIFTDLIVVDKNLQTISSSYWKYQKLLPDISSNWKKFLSQNVITGCTIMINQQTKTFVIPYNINTMAHDHWIGVNVAKYGKVWFLTNQTVIYRQHDKNVTGVYTFGWKYLSNKIVKIYSLVIFFHKTSRYFKEISIFELIYYKIHINLIRLCKQNN